MKSCTTISRVVTTGLLMAVAGPVAAQQAYPSKPLRVILPNPPGGGTTFLGRLIAQKLNESWGQPVIVDNRGGGYGLIAGEALAKSPPDGHTLMIMSSTHLITPMLIPAPYDAIKDFTPVAMLTSQEHVLVLHPSIPANNLREFIALAKARPGQLNYASSGGGSGFHLDAVLFEMMTEVKMQHVPYKGGGPAVTDLLGGQVQLSFQGPPQVVAHIKSGRLKGIAVTGEARLRALPQVPTFAEGGLPEFRAVGGWYGILAPAGTPKTVVDKLAAEIARILAMPNVRETLVGQGNDPFISTPDQFAALMTTTAGRVAKIIKFADIKIE